jgi:hypothetical protein
MIGSVPTSVRDRR